ncbi:CGH_1_collapsed_G0015250.mRNA.1.CDS.1 [Saccharomyces cerevisiae]|nr:CGH_1_collapsed_G0015250.mRNA.1.CDS.1 [Saccharomyces cerevisiae]
MISLFTRARGEVLILYLLHPHQVSDTMKNLSNKTAQMKSMSFGSLISVISNKKVLGHVPAENTNPLTTGNEED